MEAQSPVASNPQVAGAALPSGEQVQITAQVNPPAVPVTAAAAVSVAVPAGTEMHVTKKGESLPGMVHTYLPKTQYLTGSELEAAIRGANPGLKGIWFKPDQQVLVPGMLPADFTEHSVAVPKDSRFAPYI